MEIIPVINCSDLKCVLLKVEAAKSFLQPGDFLHLDVADAVFTPHKTWNDPRAWRDMQAPFSLEVHLMVEHPEIWIEPWLGAGAKRFVLHIEALNEKSFGAIRKRCEKKGVEIMLSSNPETPVERFVPYLSTTKFFQVLSVNPGFSGQAFLPLTLAKVKWIKENARDATIEVDGGMNARTAKLAKDAGADIVVLSSYIWGGGDAKERYEELKRV